jgi:hypothetical protein
MICPIMSKYVWKGISHDENRLHTVECKEHNCAWWNIVDEQCAIITISDGLVTTAKLAARMYSDK